MTEWVVRLVEEGGYGAIALLMLLETIIPPIPSEVIMPLAGVIAARGKLSLPGVILSGSAGAMIGNFAWYLLARAIGIARLRPWLGRHGRWLTLDWGEVEKLEGLFARWGGPIVGVARMLPNARSLISVPAGLIRMPPGRFLLWSTLGTIGWSAGLALAGYLLGRQFQGIERVLGPVSTGLIVVMVAVYVWRQLTWKRRHKR